ncbi:MAG: hypothetical protein FJX03_05250 [Alphaproteobacteria bacterium]|nr:hypothetical protein [Alphaproteobacteria bacterium]
MYKRKNIFHFTDIDSLISIILGERILCSSVKAKLPKNLDFLPGRHLAPIIMKNIIDSDNSVERLRVIIDSVAGAVIPIIVMSYLFSTTTSCKNRHHWRLYAKDKGCCLQLCASEIRSQINYVDEGKLNYDSRAFEHRYVKNFLHHLLENKIKSMSDRAARSFMRAVVFSKYIEYVDDTEYRFLFQDLISQDEYDRRK